MRTIFYHETEPYQGLSIETAGEGLQTIRDCERLLEVVEMIKRWCEEDGTFLAEERRKQADAYWKAEMAMLATTPQDSTP
jgi:hypothetical protein